MVLQSHVPDLLQTTDDSNLEMDDPASSYTDNLKLTILVGAIALVAIYAWCLMCLDQKLSEDKENDRASEKRAGGIKEEAKNSSDTSISDVPDFKDQALDFSTPEELGQDADSDEGSLETEGWRVVG